MARTLFAHRNEEGTCRGAACSPGPQLRFDMASAGGMSLAAHLARRWRPRASAPASRQAWRQRHRGSGAGPTARAHDAAAPLCSSASRATQVSAVRVSSSDSHTSVAWSDGHSSTFNNKWLRDSCPSRFHPTSGQRQTDPTELRGPAVRPVLVEMRGDELVVEWGPSSGAAAKHTSRYPMRWLRDHCSSREARTQRAREAPRRSLWTAEFAASIPRFSCGDILAGGSAVPPESHFSPALRAALDSLWEFGVVIVTGTPLTAEGTREICEQFGVIERTFYSDAVWDTAPKDAADVNDTAYTNLALPPHTDCTYLTLPPALQAFNCVAQSAEGGCTRVVDGFQVAEHLRVNAPEAFRFFAETPLPFFCTEPGVSVRATHPGENAAGEGPGESERGCAGTEAPSSNHTRGACGM